MAYEGGDFKRIAELPYEIIPGDSSYLPGECISGAGHCGGERLERLAIGLPVRDMSKHIPVEEGIEESAVAKRFYEAPLVNIIKAACSACPENEVRVSDSCPAALAHPCTEVCPKEAISIVQGRSYIDREKCIQCGRCASVCPYGAIVKLERPCVKACGVGAIHARRAGQGSDRL